MININCNIAMTSITWYQKYSLLKHDRFPDFYDLEFLC